MADSVYKVIELIGTSTESWEKAAAAAVSRAGESLRDLRFARNDGREVSCTASQRRQRAHIDVDCAFGLGDHAQHFGIEGDVGEAQLADLSRNPQAVLVLLEIGDHGRNLSLGVGGERLEVDGRLFPQRLLQMRDGRTRRGAQ